MRLVRSLQRASKHTQGSSQQKAKSFPSTITNMLSAHYTKKLPFQQCLSPVASALKARPLEQQVRQGLVPYFKPVCYISDRAMGNQKHSKG